MNDLRPTFSYSIVMPVAGTGSAFLALVGLGLVISASATLMM